MPKDKRQVIRMRASSPDVQIVEAAQVGRACVPILPGIFVSVIERRSATSIGGGLVADDIRRFR